MVATMSVWAWLAIGLVGWLTLSTVVGLSIAAILGRVSRDVSERIDAEAGAATPLTRERSASVPLSS
jgi:hypothetical protein